MCKKIKFLLSAIIVFGIIILTNNVYAASASISASNTNIEPGKSSTITVSVSSTEAWNLKLSSSGGNLSGNLSAADAMGSEVSQNVITANFTSSTEGSYTITLSGQITGSDLVKQSVSKSITIKVKAKEEAPSTPSTPSQPTEPSAPTVSSNANLSNLGIRPSEYDFKGFKASKTSYEVTVPNEVESIEIYANKQDSKASIEGIGQKKLQEGTNVFKIVVTAENGNTKTYQLNVIRQVASTDVTPNSVEDTADSTGEQSTIGLSKLEVKGFTLSPEFVVNTYRYIIELEDEDALTLEQVKELISAEVNFEGGTFEITGEDILDKEENEVMISVKDADGREIAIYTLVFKMKKVEDTSDTVAETTGIIENEKTTLDKDKIIIIASIIIISIIALKSSITSYKQRKILQANGLIKVKEYDEEEFIEEEENRLEENNEIIEEEKIIENEPSEENKNDYIKDIFENNQMEFNPDDKDFIKKKRGRGKHS